MCVTRGFSLVMVLLISSACSNINTGAPVESLPENAKRVLITLEQCREQGGAVVGDIGDGRIHQADFRCSSGLKPIGSIDYPKGAPIPIEGSVCCR